MTRINDMKLVRLFTERLPKSRQILGLYAVIVFLVYSWMLFVSFYKLPSWTFYLTAGEILSVYAYAFSMSLLDSLVALVAILLLDITIFFVLRNKDDFLSRSNWIAIVFLISSMLKMYTSQDYESAAAFFSGELTWWTITLLIGLPFSILISRAPRLRQVLELLSDRAVVFLYIYLPLSLVALIVVFIRHIV